MADWVTMWQEARGRKWQPTTVRDHRSRAARIVEDIGMVRLVDLVPLLVDAWLDQMRRGGVGAGAIRGRVSTLKAAASWGVSRRMLRANPLRGRHDLLRLSRFGKISGGVVEERKRTAGLAHTSTATAVVRTKFVGFKGDSCDSTEDAKTDDQVVALLLHHRALKPHEGPGQHLDSITRPNCSSSPVSLDSPPVGASHDERRMPVASASRLSDRRHRTT